MLAMLAAVFVGVGIVLAAAFGVAFFLLVLAWRILTWPLRALSLGARRPASRATYTHQGIEVEVIPPGDRSRRDAP